MTKIKITLASMNIVEKDLVTCFTGTNGDYVVFDSGNVNAMGLPIICISRFSGSSCEKIVDQAEWAAVKENLKTIISGTALPYVAVPENVTAPDDFFTQLTLPVASFEVLKNGYVAPAPAVAPAPEASIAAAPAMEAPSISEPVVEPMAAAPVMPEVPTVDMGPVPSVPSEAELPSASIAPVIPDVAPVEPAAPEISIPSIPTVEIAPEQPVASAPEIGMPTAGLPNADLPTSIEPVLPSDAITPVMESDSAIGDIASIKNTFMKSCENMFDALVKQLENK